MRKEEAKPEAGEVTLKAEVNPNGENTKCEFQYNLAGKGFGAGSTKVPCAKAPGEEEEFVPESTVVKGLAGGQEYEFRLFAESSSGKTEPVGTKFFVSVEGAPKAETLAAGEVGATGATVNGTVNPKGVATTCKFEYGTTIAYGKETQCATEPGSGDAPVAVSAKLTGLASTTAYHFRLVAENSSHAQSIGLDKEFKTTEPAVKPTAEVLPASAITQTDATLNGEVNPGGESGTCEFEYGTSLPSATKVPCASLAWCRARSGRGVGRRRQPDPRGGLPLQADRHQRCGGR